MQTSKRFASHWDGHPTNASVQGASDLQFVLDHVEGVIGEVHLLDAVDDLLLRLRVDGLLSQLPQLLLASNDKDKKERYDGCPLGLKSYRHAGPKKHKQASKTQGLHHVLSNKNSREGL